MKKYAIEKTKYEFGIDHEEISSDMTEMYNKAQEDCCRANSEFDVETIAEYDSFDEAVANKPANEYETFDNYAPIGKETLFCGTWYIISEIEYGDDGDIVDIKEMLI